MKDPLTWLTECHERIRRFTTGLQRMIALPDPLDPRLPPAATQCARYYREGLPLHARDEDESLAPHLQDAGEDVRVALLRMAAEHHRIDELLPPLLAVLDRIAQADATALPELEGVAEPFIALMLEHIAVEESVVFPAVSRLPAVVQTAALAEMHRRRGR